MLNCLIAVLLIVAFSLPVWAAECKWSDCSTIEECERRIKECEEIIGLYESATGKNKEDLLALEKEIEKIRGMINSASAQINALQQNIFEKEVDLAYQEEVLAARVRRYYIRSQKYSPLLLFLSSSSASELTRELSYRLSLANEDRRIIIEISEDLIGLKDDKEKLEENKAWLAKKKAQVDERAEFLRGEIAKAEEYIGELRGTVVSLTSRQQALLVEKAGVFKTSVGEVPPADDPNARPDFDPGFRPAFASFSFGAPHRKGMSQYGAFGRAKAGQNTETILKAYYGDVRIEQRDLPATISTTVGTLPFEDNYMKGIAEMPSKWGDEGGFEALKAQAIAARSYAIQAGKPICITEACQVYSSSKAANPPDTWRRAVEETRGKVIVSNQSNDVVSAWYASTAGGYVYSYTSVGHTTPGIWDTSCGNQSCWTDEAWEKKAGSPWFYKGWYKSRSGASCGRSHPWLTEEQFADILNAIIVYRSGQGVEHILPVDYVSCFGAGGDPWSIEQMRQNADGRGGAITSVGSVDITYSTDGKTAKLVIGTNRGSFEVSGEEFKTVFNLRAPGRIALKSSLFNIEKK